MDEGGDGEVLNGFLLGKGRMVIMVGVMVVVWCDEVVVARKLFEEMCMVICEDGTHLGYDLGGDNVFV
ncbi:hypothetical protein Tco_0656282 [Tanacetum coccineum]|uniref:Transmembrane protein n=1 Tax=Tanacetum coccineum TaxID=301880 RepID=A0ABQ4X8B9_9ASTR